MQDTVSDTVLDTCQLYTDKFVKFMTMCKGNVLKWDKNLRTALKMSMTTLAQADHQLSQKFCFCCPYKIQEYRRFTITKCSLDFI